jgi:hypothetical protein
MVEQEFIGLLMGNCAAKPRAADRLAWVWPPAGRIIMTPYHPSNSYPFSVRLIMELTFIRSSSMRRFSKAKHVASTQVSRKAASLMRGIPGCRVGGDHTEVNGRVEGDDASRGVEVNGPASVFVSGARVTGWFVGVPGVGDLMGLIGQAGRMSE